MGRYSERDGKKKTETWENMKKELKRKYLSFNYYQDIYLKIQNFKQQDLSVEEYLAKFVNLIIKRDLQKVEEICIANYIAGLRYDVVKVIFLQSYHSLQDVMKLALKVWAKNNIETLLQLRVWLMTSLLRVIILGILVILKLPPLK